MEEQHDIGESSVKMHQEVIDSAIRKLKDNYIFRLTEVSKLLKRKIRKENSNDNKVMCNSSIVSIKLAYCFYILNSLKSCKNNTLKISHPLVIKAVDTAINLVENKDIKNLVRKVNKDIFYVIYNIPDHTVKNALTQVSCGVCKSKTLREGCFNYLILKPAIPVVCKTCGIESYIDFGIEEDGQEE